jgi:hypothetical protein
MRGQWAIMTLIVMACCDEDYTLSKANFSVAFFADVIVVNASCAPVYANTLCKCLQNSNPEFTYTCVIGYCFCKKKNCSMTMNILATTYGGNRHGIAMSVRHLPWFISQCRFWLDEDNFVDEVIMVCTIILYVVGGIVALLILTFFVRCCLLCHRMRGLV